MHVQRNSIQDKKGGETERERIIRFVRMHLQLKRRNGSCGGRKKEGKHHEEKLVDRKSPFFILHPARSL